MIKMITTPEMLEQARNEADKIGRLKNSIRNGEGNVYGCLGEIMVRKYFKEKADNNLDYDLTLRNLKIEVKTKVRSGMPLPHYDCTVSDYNAKQQCDFYVFVSMLKDLSAGWIVGALTKDEFFKEATFSRKGDVDPRTPNGWAYKADCYNVPVSKVKDADQVIAIESRRAQTVDG